MPIYEYECSVCHHHFDFLQKVNDEPLKACPQCYQQTAVRLVSAPGFRLKGTGWYETDYKTKDSTAPADSSAKPAATDTRPEAKTTNK